MAIAIANHEGKSNGNGNGGGNVKGNMDGKKMTGTKVTATLVATERKHIPIEKESSGGI